MEGALPRWVDVDRYDDLQVLGTVSMLGEWMDQIESDAPVQALVAQRSALTAAVASTVGMQPTNALRDMVRAAVQRKDPALLRRVAAVALPRLEVALRLVAEERPLDATGTLASINSSSGGVPKQQVESGVIDADAGLVGDRQGAPRHHGRPWQAISLWSAEVIDALVAEGHPIAPGRAGENLTLSGLPWADVRPGHRLAVGTEVQLLVTAYAIPCSKNSQWFSDGNEERMAQDAHPGESRLYAAVLVGGPVAVGDPVRVVA
jgi:MOSC domain-containing protein YiiM